MHRIAIVSGSPSESSRTLLLARYAKANLERRGCTVDLVNVRELPADDLCAARAESVAMNAALGVVETARGVVVATPVYKAAYSGLLKVFLDALPQFGLKGKSVLPLAVGGSAAHVLAIDYALRPVLMSLGAWHVEGGLFVREEQLRMREDGGLDLDAGVQQTLDGVLGAFHGSVAVLGEAG